MTTTMTLTAAASTTDGFTVFIIIDHVSDDPYNSCTDHQ